MRVDVPGIPGDAQEIAVVNQFESRRGRRALPCRQPTLPGGSLELRFRDNAKVLSSLITEDQGQRIQAALATLQYPGQ